MHFLKAVPTQPMPSAFQETFQKKDGSMTHTPLRVLKADYETEDGMGHTAKFAVSAAKCLRSLSRENLQKAVVT